MKDILSYTQMPKATYMYWQKRFDRENPDQDVENKIQEIRSQHKDYGYRRMTGELKNQGICVNKKKVSTYHAETEPSGNIFYPEEP